MVWPNRTYERGAGVALLAVPYLGDNELVRWLGKPKREEDQEWRREEEQRFQLMALLSLAVEYAMGEQRSGRDVDEVRAGVITTLSTGPPGFAAFEPEQVAAIADSLVAPGLNNMGGADILAKLASETGVDGGPQDPFFLERAHRQSPPPEPSTKVAPEKNQVTGAPFTAGAVDCMCGCGMRGRSIKSYDGHVSTCECGTCHGIRSRNRERSRRNSG